MVGKGGQVLVTGGTGFVGSAVIQAVLARGFLVRALVRKDSPTANLSGLDCEIVAGDMMDGASLLRAMQGMQFVFHVAADYRLWARHPDDIVHTNVEGTRLGMEAGQRAGVERIVYTSSVASLKPLPDGAPSDETHPVKPEDAIGAYKYSKAAAERLVEKMIAETGLPAVI